MKRILSRRAFLQGSAAAAAGGMLLSKTVMLEAPPMRRAVAPSDRVRFGMIGIGMQGSGLLGGAITIPGVECVGAADLYDGRHTLAREITGNPACLPRGTIRSCSIGRISTASWPRFRITGTAAWWSTPAMRARISIARNRCRTMSPTDWRWWRRRKRIIASCRSDRNA